VRAIDYALRQGWASLVRGKGSSVFAVLAIALASSVLGAVALVTFNADRVLARWWESAEFSVYLRDDATSEQRGVVETLLDQSGAVRGREYVSKDQALARFRREFAELASMTSELGENPFPASLEVRLLERADADGSAELLLKRVATLPGVSDVRYDRAWLARVGRGLEVLRRVGVALALWLAAAAAVTVASVVRLGMHARKDEIEIMELVGASAVFIRGPFVAEGLLQGGLGALVALVGVFTGYRIAMAVWGMDLSLALDGMAPRFLPLPVCAALVAGGMLVGSLGGLIASGRATGSP
jgi:cell division transport system permease protein